MGINSPTASVRGIIGTLALSITANMLVFAYLFAGNTDEILLFGMLGGFAGAFLLLTFNGAAARGHGRSRANERASGRTPAQRTFDDRFHPAHFRARQPENRSGGREFFRPQVPGRHTEHGPE